MNKLVYLSSVPKEGLREASLWGTQWYSWSSGTDSMILNHRKEFASVPREVGINWAPSE